MQILLLEVFRTVARVGSITRAAEVLGYTQSAVSRQIVALEAETGVTLLDRLPRGIDLTEAGRSLLEHAEVIVERLATARRDLEALRQLDAGQLRVGAFPTAVARLVPRAIAAFRADHPKVAVTLVEDRTPGLLKRLESGDADVAVVSAPPDDEPLDRRRFTLHHLVDEQLLVAMPADHPLAAQPDVGLSDLAGDPFIVGSPTAEQTLMRARFPAGFQPRVDFAVADWTGKLGCVAAGLGVAFVPALATSAAPGGVVLRRLPAAETATRRIFAAAARARHDTAAVAEFVTMLRREAAELDAVGWAEGAPGRPGSGRTPGGGAGHPATTVEGEAR
ncbi:MAG TPA: LysR family transcriptional regulator [Jiangellales bacterium]|nr:LysR family transcriptional regulator [Jiangellales bacterium]